MTLCQGEMLLASAAAVRRQVARHPVSASDLVRLARACGHGFELVCGHLAAGELDESATRLSFPCQMVARRRDMPRGAPSHDSVWDLARPHPARKELGFLATALAHGRAELDLAGRVYMEAELGTYLVRVLAETAADMLSVAASALKEPVSRWTPARF